MNRETGETEMLSYSKHFAATQNKEQVVYNESNFYINNRVTKDGENHHKCHKILFMLKFRYT